MKIKKLDAKINDGLVLFPRSFIIPAESMSKESNPISISRYISLCRIDHKGWIIFSPDGSLNITGIRVRYRDSYYPTTKDVNFGFRIAKTAGK